MSDYYTHQKYLRSELENLKKNDIINCLEFGTGDGSSSIFHEYAKKINNLKIKAFDSDLYWLNKTKEKFSLENYEFFYVDDWDYFFHRTTFGDVYDLVFVDQSPWESRIKTIDFLKTKSKNIILHDFDYFNGGFCENTYSAGECSFFFKKYNEDFELFPFTELSPPTLVMRNKKKI